MTTKPEKSPSEDAAAERQHRSVYTKQFKLAAVARLNDGKQTAEALALELGVRRNQLYKWAKALEQKGPEASFSSRGRKPASEESEIVQLKRQLARAQEELAILKKFDAYLKRQKQ
ncbi:transposase [Pseudoduganella albidiflava]|nr:transposase [Pseudoduganella albidiflava]QBH99702.1 transposase [Pseudoduganella albidiflava]QBI00988.1 transposase [Pseudoduganella albidiflava]QBI02044.1 transposase [Pseudoduganella albidiflava]QBI03130.1 transposase [Pseudoduganella albidiflava]